MFNVGPMSPSLAPIFNQIAEKDMAFVKRVMITRISKPALDAGQAEINRAVDSPTPWTMRAVKRRPVVDGRAVLNGRPVASGRPFAYEVYLPDEASKGGISAAEYLGPNIFGGPRGLKRSEKALYREGVMGSGLFAMPGAAARLDSYGNMSRGQVTQLLSYLRSSNAAGYSSKTTDKRKAALAKGNKRTGKRGIAYFVSVGKGKGGRGTRKHNLPAGIWQRTSFGPLGSAVKPVVIFTKAPTYQPRIWFFRAIDRAVDREVGPQFEQAMRDLMSKWVGKGR